MQLVHQHCYICKHYFEQTRIVFLKDYQYMMKKKIGPENISRKARVWASIRAQTMPRTVSGMMYYEKSLRFLANSERVN